MLTLILRKGTVYAVANMFSAPWPHDAHDAHVDANDMREGDRSVWRFAARCLPRLNLIEDWLDLRRRKAREWLPHIRNTIEVLIRVYDGAKVEPGTITDSKELFYCLAWRGCLDSRSWAKDHEWGTILQDWILLATHDIIQILEGFRRPDVAAPEQVKMTKWRVVKGWVKTW